MLCYAMQLPGYYLKRVESMQVMSLSQSSMATQESQQQQSDTHPLPNRHASLPELWDYLLPALERLRPPEPGSPPAPALEIVYRMNVHTAVFNYFNSKYTSPKGYSELYRRIDQYFAEQACKALRALPAEGPPLVAGLLDAFARYNVHARAVARLLQHMDRFYVRREVMEGCGWSREPGVQPTRSPAQIKYSKKARLENLRLWGYDSDSTAADSTPEAMVRAETCAEAASPHECVVPLYSLALRRFRTECIEPLIATPQGRLVHAMYDLLGAPRDTAASDEAVTEERQQRQQMMGEVKEMLKAVGVRPDHELRRKLDEYANSLA